MSNNNNAARIVCLVLADENGTLSCIDGEELTTIISDTLRVYKLSDVGIGRHKLIESVMQAVLGKDETPLEYDEQDCSIEPVG